ncbi:MAG: ACT domain-containing protein [SAR324 cluster bacterium]|nr:ACT domain-containing protein [SAR324 cluster bacterium]
MQKIATSVNLVLSVLSETFTIHQLSQDVSIPEEILKCNYYSVSKTENELSLVCSEVIEVQSLQSSKGWKCIKVAGPLDFNLTGILAGISDILAQTNISIFAISTFDTDYILVKTQDLSSARAKLRKAGYKFE